MSAERPFDYVEADLEKLLEVLLTHLDNPWEREEILKTFQVLLKESKGLVESLSADHGDLADSLLFYQQQREEKHARAARLKKLFSFFQSEKDVEEEAFKKAVRDTEKIRNTLSLSQDSSITGLTQTHTELVTSLKTLLFRLIDESEVGRETAKALLERLFGQILEEEQVA